VTASTAPTARLGGGRRRFPLATALVVVLGVGIAGCGGPLAAERSPVPAGPLGPVVARADVVGPDIECRGVARDRCLRAGTIEGTVAGVPVSDIERVIVSCEGAPCTVAGGAMRLDVLLRDGSTVEVARGGYGEFRQP